jgi:diguanylate cyclase (GGDEF)-like protein/PAS domain S-box-containing protein
MADELQRAVEHARSEEQRCRELVEQASDGIFVSDANHRYIEVNARACDLTGYSRQELLAMGPADLITAENLDHVLLRLAEVRDHGRVLHERRLRRNNGSDVDVEVSAVMLSNGHLQAIVRDVSVRKAAERQLAHEARHDALTGLANRFLLRDRLSQRFDEFRNSADDQFALLLIDLDGSKVINETRGHAAGDAVLVEIGRRLMALIRPADTVARLGGDEFAILVHDTVDAVPLLARRIVEEVGRPLDSAHGVVAVGASVGIALAPRHADEPVSPMRCADIAMYAVKRGGTGHAIFGAALDADLAT